MTHALHRLAVFAAVTAFIVIVLGAYVRLSHAGLGCPDWPGCYGQLTWPVEATEIADATQAFPDRPVEHHKAWKEMVHRYLAGILVLLVLAINVLAWRSRSVTRKVRWLAAFGLILILFQAALGMWTVTLKLLPVIVMAHLIGGLATFSLLLWIAWQRPKDTFSGEVSPFSSFRTLILAGFFMLLVQLALGGWTSANYSALACPDFPVCQGQWWPDTNFEDGFRLWREVGVDYEGGVLDLPSRTSIQISHRIGALVTFLLLGSLAFRLVRSSQCRAAGAVLGALLLSQVTLGILNVVLFLPLPNAVAHNAFGALLLAMMLWLVQRSSRQRS